jgi:hypothetical protein
LVLASLRLTSCMLQNVDLMDTFSKGEVIPFGPIALSPSAGVINYRQVSEEASHLVSYLYIYWIGNLEQL